MQSVLSAYLKIKKRLFSNYYAKLDAKHRVQEIFSTLCTDENIHTMNVIADEESRYVVRVFCKSPHDNNKIMTIPPRMRFCIFSVVKNGMDVKDIMMKSTGLYLDSKKQQEAVRREVFNHGVF